MQESNEPNQNVIKNVLGTIRSVWVCRERSQSHVDFSALQLQMWGGSGAVVLFIFICIFIPTAWSTES